MAMSDDFTIDDMDRAIVEQLRVNGRATNQQIANTLGLTAATVSARIRRMEEADKLRVVAVSDFSAHGYNVLMEVAIEVDGQSSHAQSVQKDSARRNRLVAAGWTVLSITPADIRDRPDHVVSLVATMIAKLRGARP